MKQDSRPSACSPLALKILSTFRELQRDLLDLHSFLEITGEKAPERREAVLDAVAELVFHGLLLERGSDFYSISEAGRLAIAPPRELTLLSRPDCHICEDACKIIAPLAGELALSLREVNVDEDSALQRRYGNDIPVLFRGSEEIARHSVDAGTLRSVLGSASRP
jgi:thioredoxin reductase (NADPH)